MIKNIVFDVGRVLVVWDPNVVYKPYFNNDENALQRFYSETEIHLADREMDRGVSATEILRELAARFPHYQEPLFFWNDKWEEMLVGQVDGSVAILRNLQKQNYKLFGLTNWSTETFPLIKARYDFFNCFHDIVVSGEVKCIKPDPEIYQILLQKHSLDPDTCVFIDDNSDNVNAAIDLGINGILFESPEQLAMDLKRYSIQV